MKKETSTTFIQNIPEVFGQEPNRQEPTSQDETSQDETSQENYNDDTSGNMTHEEAPL